MSTIQNKQISDFLNNEVKDYARYVIETRACPKLADGLRSGARKALYAGITGELKKKEKIKLLTLTGDTLKMQYHHGDASLHNTIVQLSSDYIFKYKPFDIIGQVGYIRQTQIDVAPRYLTIKKSPYIDIFETDKELWLIQEDDGEKIEPKYFYPIIPITLLYRTNSPGFGFSFRCFSYTLDSIIDNCIASIATGNCSESNIILVPDIVGIKNQNFVYNSFKNLWFSIGEYQLNFDTDTLNIYDLPFNVQYEQYDNYLQSLQDKGIIKSFNNFSTGEKTSYSVKFQHGQLQRIYNQKASFFQTFKLWSKVPKDTLNLIDNNNNIIQFDNPYQLVDNFVKLRLKVYSQRKTKTINILKKDIDDMNQLIKFISLVVDGKLIINKRPIKDIKIDLDKQNLPESMLKVNIDKLTKDEIDKLKQKIKETQDYLKYIETTPIEEIYVNELIEMKNKFSNIETVNVL